MKNITKNLICIITTLIIGAIAYYFALPALNIQSFGFWLFVIFLTTIYGFTMLMVSIDSMGKVKNYPNGVIFLSFSGFIIIGLILIINVIVSPLFQSRSYSKRIIVDETSTFSNDVKEIDIKSLPLLDKESSQKLGDRVMGQMPELVSQFYVSDLYTQINYNDDIVRITPLEYNGFFKYLSNRKTGVKGYITVNSVTGDSKLTKLDKGMKILPSGILGDDLHRTLRFKYPMDVFGMETFEIDNEGNPYWIVPVMKYTGVGLKRDVKEVIILNPVDGKSKKYDVKDVPTWVDHVYSSELVIEQVNNWGMYKDGFLNSLFGQKGVVKTTTGYNYTVMNDDVYLYTGITSAASDESNIGFILTNLRTKETKFYSAPGAEEYSAMSSAEGQVQQMKYKASFPLLVNVNDKATYLISLKDNAGLVKMYAFVDVEDYQKVVVTDSSKGIQKAIDNYLDEVSGDVSEDKYITKSIMVSSIVTANIDGNTNYYIIDELGNKYKASIKIAINKLPFIKKGDSLTISYTKEKEVIEIQKIQ
ncbi:MAG: hypothetical protein PHQ64_01085 [Bacilli bacterium]|nr:hypothetical protein [Bacilli bacterium]